MLQAPSSCTRQRRISLDGACRSWRCPKRQLCLLPATWRAMQARKGARSVLGKGASASHRDPLLVEPACSLTLLKVEPGWADPSPHDLGEQRTAVAWTGHWARTGGCSQQLILGACRGPLLDFPTLTRPGGREETPCQMPRAQPEATEADRGFGTKVPTPPPSMTAEKRLSIPLLLPSRPFQEPRGLAPATTRPAGLTRVGGSPALGSSPPHQGDSPPGPPSASFPGLWPRRAGGTLRSSASPWDKLRRKRTLPPTAAGRPLRNIH